MKNISYYRNSLALLFTFLFISLVSCSDKSKEVTQRTTPDALAEEVFECFVANDADRFLNTVSASKDQMRTLFLAFNENQINSLKEEKAPIEEIDRKRKRYEEELEELEYHSSASKERLRNSFKIVRRKAENDGVLWETAKFKKAEYEIRLKGGIKMIDDLFILFDVGGRDFVIKLDDVYWTETFWITTEDRVIWSGKRE